MRSALVLTNHLNDWAGSEIVALEVAETLAQRTQVTLVANSFSKEMQAYARQLNIKPLNAPGEIDLHEHDFIWAQHYVAPLCKGFDSLGSYQGSFNSVHLSPYEPLEMASLDYSIRIGANIIANSEEIKRKIESIAGVSCNVYNINNATKPEFNQDKKFNNYTALPKCIAIISNHVQSEIIDAIKILEANNIRVDIFGKGQKNYYRITPEVIDRYDAIASIGKSVQYAILRRRPVYCYDRFGGPGWITQDNADIALLHNFSGRCVGIKMTAKEIASDIIKHFTGTQKQVNQLHGTYCEKFNLDEVITNLYNSKTRLSSKGILPYSIFCAATQIKNTYISTLDYRNDYHIYNASQKIKKLTRSCKITIESGILS